MLTDGTLSLFNLAAAIWMTSIVWVMQLVHYPTFARLGQIASREVFIDFVRAHGFWISFLVMPAMIFELWVASYWFAISPGKADSMFNAACVWLTWIITLAWSARAHQKLATLGYHEPTYRSLIHSNLARTLVWSIRLLFIAYLWIQKTL